MYKALAGIEKLEIERDKWKDKAEHMQDFYHESQLEIKELLAKIGELDLKVKSLILGSNDIKNLEDHLQDAFPVNQR
jgi:hypothetical protein